MNLNQITLPSLDVERSIAFYQKMGMQLIVRSLPQYARFLCPDGDATFSVHLVDELPHGNTAWIYFECNDLDAIVWQLKTKGITIDEQPEDKPWLWREARIKDPDNNQIILYYAGPNRMDPPWKVKG